MSNHEQNGEVIPEDVVEEVIEEMTHQDRFGQTLDKIQEQDIPTDPEEDESETDEVDAGEQEEEIVPTPAIEGPTAAMKAVAKQQGVPAELIETARDDEQLEAWMGIVANRQAEPTPAPEAEYGTSLPEDEFTEDDPVRREFIAQRQHQEEKYDSLRGNVEKILTYVLDQGDQLSQMTTQSVEAEQKGFHSHFDGFSNPVLGKSGSLSREADQMRGLIHQTFMDLKQEFPGTSDTALMDKSASKYGIQSKSTLRNDAVRKQAQQRLGGPESAKGAPEPKMTRQESFDQKMEQIHARSGA